MAKTVFTNGCFDILHPGHIDLLNQARLLGDRLVVGINSDESVRAIKGPGRPINDQEARKAVLLGLRAVDEVVIFDETMAVPYPAIRQHTFSSINAFIISASSGDSSRISV